MRFLLLSLLLIFSTELQASAPLPFYIGFRNGDLWYNNVSGAEDSRAMMEIISANDSQCLIGLLKQMDQILKSGTLPMHTERLEIAAGRFNLGAKVGVEVICASERTNNIMQVSTKQKELTCKHFIFEPVIYTTEDDRQNLLVRLYKPELIKNEIHIVNTQTKKKVVTTDFKKLSDLDVLGKNFCARGESTFNTKTFEFLIAEGQKKLAEKAKAQEEAKKPKPRPTFYY